MTKKFILSICLCLAAVSMFSSCSDDDDDNGGGGASGSSFATVDGRTEKFKCCYIIPFDHDDVYSDERGYELCASTVDLLSLNPNKVKYNDTFSYLSIDVILDESNQVRDCDIEIGFDDSLYQAVVDKDFDEDSDEDYYVAPTYIWYISDWNVSLSEIPFSKDGNHFKISSFEFPVLASEMGVDDGIDDNCRKTTAKIGFESSNVINVNSYSRSLSNIQVVTDPEQIKIIRKVTNRNRVKTQIQK